MDNELPEEAKKLIAKRQYQRRAYLRRKDKQAELAEKRLQERIAKLREECQMEGTEGSLPNPP